jgi:hypothetical protein
VENDSFAKVREDFEALKAKLKASADQLEPERYDEITARIVALDEATIKEQIARRRGSYRIERMMAEIEGRLCAAEEHERDRT